MTEPQDALLRCSKGPMALTCIESVTSRIDHQLSPTFSFLPVSSCLRFDSIFPDDFTALSSTKTSVGRAFQEAPGKPRLQKSLCNLSPCAHQLQLFNTSSHPEMHDDPYSRCPPILCSRTIFTDPNLQSLRKIFNVSSGTEFLHFSGRYKDSRIKGFYWPTLVVKTGWSEDRTDLMEDAKLWLLGSRGGSFSAARQHRYSHFSTPNILRQTNRPSQDILKSGTVTQPMRCDQTGSINDEGSQFYPTPPANGATVEFTLEEIVRATNVPAGMLGTTVIRFDLTRLAELVEDNIENLIIDLQEKRRRKAAKQQEEEKATRMSKQQQI